MPIPSVTEKPRTGPEPSTKRMTATMKVVRFASMIAESARL